MKEKYLIGDVSQLLRLSKDTLRYYDKLGIVSPKKDPANNYRYYTIEDLLALSYVIVFKDLEISLEEIKQLIKNNSLNDFSQLLDKQHALIDEKLQKMTLLKNKVIQFQEAIALTQSLLGKIKLNYSPPLVYQPMQKEWDTQYADYLAKMSDDAHIISPVFSALIPQSFLNEETPTTFSYGISGIITDLGHLSKVSKYEYLPPKLCIHTVIRATEHIYPSDLSTIQTYLAHHQFNLCGDILARNIAFEHCNQTPMDYYELWLPINNS